MKWALKNFGLTALGLCLLCTAVEMGSVYKAYINHENGREENLHKAYSNMLMKMANAKAVEVALPSSALAPPIALQEIKEKMGRGK